MKKENIRFDEFQKLVQETYYFAGETKREELLYLALATNSEAGEMADEIKKLMRDDGGELTPDREYKIKREMGDSLFYMAILAEKLGFNLHEAAIAELDKLGDFIGDWETNTGEEFTPEKFKFSKQARAKKTRKIYDEPLVKVEKKANWEKSFMGDLLNQDKCSSSQETRVPKEVMDKVITDYIHDYGPEGCYELADALKKAADDDMNAALEHGIFK